MPAGLHVPCARAAPDPGDMRTRTALDATINSITVTPFDNVTVSCFGCAARPHDGPTLRPRCPPTGAHMPRLLASGFSGGKRSRPFATRFTPPKSADSATLPGPHTGKSFDYVIAGVQDRAPRVCGLRTGGASCAAASDRRPGAYEGPLQRNHRGGSSRLPNRHFGRETTQQGGSTAALRVGNRTAGTPGSVRGQPTPVSATADTFKIFDFLRAGESR